MRRQTWENTQDEILVCRKAAIARGDIAACFQALQVLYARPPPFSPINYSILTKHSPPRTTCEEWRHARHRPWEKGMWICSVSNHERTSHRHASNRKRPQIHCPKDLYLLLSHDCQGKSRHHPANHPNHPSTISSGDIWFSPLVTCPLAQSRGSPASVISPSASTCILANSEGQPSQVAKSTRRLTHSPRFFGCDQSHNCPVHILTSPPGEGVLQLRFFKNRFEESTPHRHIKFEKTQRIDSFRDAADW